MNLPLQDGTNWECPERFQQELAEVFTKVPIAAELTKMRMWLICNPARRKTRRGIKRFIGAWLTRAFDERGKPDLRSVLATVKRCIRCNARPATHSHNANGYCIDCVNTITRPAETGEARLMESYLKKVWGTRE